MGTNKLTNKDDETIRGLQFGEDFQVNSAEITANTRIEEHVPIVYRKNGFSWPLNFWQLGLGLHFSCCFISFYALVTTALTNEEHGSKRPLQIIYAILIAVAFSLYYVATATDTTDRIVHAQRLAQKQSLPINLKDYIYYCTLCKANVNHTSKHCSKCNRCSDGFDHHCNWINSCVGKYNYRSFLGSIIVYWIMLSFHIGCSIYVLSLFQRKNFSAEASYIEVYKNLPKSTQAAKSILAILTVTNSIILCTVGHLIGYHCWIAYHKMTTYQHILNRREIYEKKIELKTGRITQLEYKEWYIKFKTEKKRKESRVIQKVYCEVEIDGPVLDDGDKEMQINHNTCDKKDPDRLAIHTSEAPAFATIIEKPGYVNNYDTVYKQYNDDENSGNFLHAQDSVYNSPEKEFRYQYSKDDENTATKNAEANGAI